MLPPARPHLPSLVKHPIYRGLSSQVRELIGDSLIQTTTVLNASTSWAVDSTQALVSRGLESIQQVREMVT